MKRFWPYLKYFKPVRWHFVGAVVAGLVYAAATGAGLPLAAKVVLPLIFEDDTGAGDEEGGIGGFFMETLQGWFGGLSEGGLLLVACSWLPLMFVFRALGGFYSAYWTSYCGYRFIEQVREETFAKLQSLPIGFFQKFQAGDLVARLSGDAEILRVSTAKVSQDLIKQPATLIGALAFLISEAVTTKGASVILLAILSIPICVIPLRTIARQLGRKAKKLQNSAGDLSGQISEAIQAPMEVRAFQLEEPLIDRFRKKVRSIIGYSMKVVKYRQLISPAVEVVSVIGLTFAIFLGAREGMTLSSFMAIAMALYLCYEPVKKLGAIHGHLKQAEASLDRLEEISMAVDELPDPESPVEVNEFGADVELDGVDFGYGDDLVLKGIDLKIRAGECVALIGPSGGGKSSLFSLIPRFYDATAGAVRVSGVDVKDWAKGDLRSKIGLVAQTAILFKGTIRENILLGRPGATDDEVEEAARKANAHDFILEQEKGYDTEVTEMGIVGGAEAAGCDCAGVFEGCSDSVIG